MYFKNYIFENKLDIFLINITNGSITQNLIRGTKGMITVFWKIMTFCSKEISLVKILSY